MPAVTSVARAATSLEPPEHRFEDHTGELRLWVRAPTLAELFAEAGRGLAAIMLGDRDHTATEQAEACEVEAPDLAALLVAWLNELIFLSEIHKKVYTEFQIEELTDRKLRAHVRGVPTTALRTQVKAATLHGLAIEELPNGFSTSVVLDV